mgnify:CR=1 FL=1
MPRFAYTTAEGGERRSGMIEAKDLAEAADILRRRSLTILRLEPAAATMSEPSTWTRCLAPLLTRQRRVEIALDQMAALLDAGVLAINALEGVAAQSPYFFGNALRGAVARIRRGTSLGDAFAAEVPWVGEIVLGLVRVGEANGRLSEMLRYASQWLERSRRVRNRIYEALAYPAIVVLLAGAVGFFLTTRVIPRILDFIAKNRGAAVLPASTQLLMDITAAVQSYGLYALIAMAAAAVGFSLAQRAELLGAWADYLLLRLPVVGPAMVAAATALWCRTLGILLGSGIHLLPGLDLVRANIPNRYLKRQFTKMREEIAQGAAIATALQKTALPRLSPIAAMMLEVGESAGAVDASLLKAAQYAEEDLMHRIEMLSRFIEPAIYIVVGIMVGFVYYAFFMATQAVTQSIIRK